MCEMAYSKETDEKWQKKWDETELYRFDDSGPGKKLYLLEMFSYPSGKNLHIGHWWNYGLADSYGRLKRMQGFRLFHPPGFDAFGLPAENYAIKTGVHPWDSTRESIAAMERQFRTMGTTCDWDREIVTCLPEYYRWTQWLFLQLYCRGLAYRKKAPVNWCPSCDTVLANEQAAGGVCERCGAEVTRREMTQWFFKITDYAEELLSGLKDLDWPEKTKKIQENWIGKSAGAEIVFQTSAGPVTVFTTRADTLMGATYIVLAPEHPLAEALCAPGYRQAVRDYREYAAKRSEIERMSTAGEKAGVFTGAYARHPVSGEKLPVWISDYVLSGYGTGAVMAVPAHDDRDFEFAKKYGLPVKAVIAPCSALPYSGDGVLTDSGAYTGLSSKAARDKIIADLEKVNLGRASVKYRLRDWLVSRQRYWGAPIPIVYCETCGEVPVPEKDLPVRLPYEVSFQPNGVSPLAACPEFTDTLCPVCGGAAKRETDTLDTFVCSSWYFLRFCDNRNSSEAFSKDKVNRLMPVDKYIGGVEHAAMHLLYARFITKALRDMGYLDFDEPFASLVHQGTILDENGKKMSKRSGAVSPDAYTERYGSDVLRLCLAFGFSYRDGGPWSDDGVKTAARFVSKTARVVWRFLDFKAAERYDARASDPELEYVLNRTIREVTRDIDDFSFNTALARMMELLNALTSYQSRRSRSVSFEERVVSDFVLLLAPLAPHFTEELWEKLSHLYSVHSQRFPVCDEAKLKRAFVEIAVQVNGTLRDVISADPSTDESGLESLALSSPKVRAALSGREVRRVIIVKGRLVNLVC